MKKEIDSIKKLAEKEIKKLKSDPNYEGTDEQNDNQNEIFIQLKNKFGYDWELDDDASEYFLKALPQEIIEYVITDILPKIEKENKGGKVLRPTKYYLDKLNKETNLEFTDSSYENDLSESVWNEENDLVVYVPNSPIDKPSEEKFGKFSITIPINDKAKLNGTSYNTIEEVIKALNKNYKKNKNKSWKSAEKKYKEIIKKKSKK